jgi:hypothetical protein
MRLKIIVTISGMFLSLTSIHSQGLKGGYIFKTGQEKEAYYFWKDGEFIWFKFTGKSRQYGKGQYVFDNDSLRLKFGIARRNFDLKSQVSLRSRSKKSLLEVRAITSNEKPVKGIRSILQHSNIVSVTDSSGNSKIEIDDAIQRDVIRFEVEGYEGYGTIDQSISLKGVDIFFVILIDEATTYVENQTITLNATKSNNSIRINRGDKSDKFKRILKRRYLGLSHKPRK